MASGLKVHSGIAPTPSDSQTGVVPSSDLLRTADKIRKIELEFFNLSLLHASYMRSGEIPESFVERVMEFSKAIESDLGDEACKSHYLNQIDEDKVSKYIEKKFQ